MLKFLNMIAASAGAEDIWNGIRKQHQIAEERRLQREAKRELRQQLKLSNLVQLFNEEGSNRMIIDYEYYKVFHGLCGWFRETIPRTVGFKISTPAVPATVLPYHLPSLQETAATLPKKSNTIAAAAENNVPTEKPQTPAAAKIQQEIHQFTAAVTPTVSSERSESPVKSPAHVAQPSPSEALPSPELDLVRERGRQFCAQWTSVMMLEVEREIIENENYSNAAEQQLLSSSESLFRKAIINRGEYEMEDLQLSQSQAISAMSIVLRKKCSRSEGLRSKHTIRSEVLASRTTRLLGKVESLEDQNRCAIISEESLQASRFEIIILKLISFLSDRFSDNHILSVEIAQREARDLLFESETFERDELFEEMAASKETSLELQGQRELTLQSNIYDLKVEEEGERERNSVVEGNSRDGLRYAFVDEVGRITHILTWRVINLEARERWDIEAWHEEDLPKPPSYEKPVYSSKTAELEAAEIGWRRVAISEEGEFFCKVCDMFGNFGWWRSVYLSELKSRKSIERESYLKRSRTYASLVDEVRLNLRSGSSADMTDPWEVLQNIDPLSPQPTAVQITESAVSSEALALVQSYYDSPLDGNNQTTVTRASQNPQSQGEEVLQSWLQFANAAQREAAEYDIEEDCEEELPSSDPWQELE